MVGVEEEAACPVTSCRRVLNCAFFCGSPNWQKYISLSNFMVAQGRESEGGGAERGVGAEVATVSLLYPTRSLQLPPLLSVLSAL